jgi:hypothetical protein
MHRKALRRLRLPIMYLFAPTPSTLWPPGGVRLSWRLGRRRRTLRSFVRNRCCERRKVNQRSSQEPSTGNGSRLLAPTFGVPRMRIGASCMRFDDRGAVNTKSGAGHFDLDTRARSLYGPSHVFIPNPPYLHPHAPQLGGDLGHAQALSASAH